MLYDVFYLGEKPNAHPREQKALSIDEARDRSTTDHFWIINEWCDYFQFDWDWCWDFLPDEEQWTKDHDNVWPSQHQKDSGTWLCSKETQGYIIYRTDVSPVTRKNEKSILWEHTDYWSETEFDYSWHPDPTSPAYIYQFGTILDRTCGPRYITPDNTGDIVYIDLDTPVEVSKYDIKTTLDDLIKDHPEEVFWATQPAIDYSNFDFDWKPELIDTEYVCTFGSTDSVETHTYFVSTINLVTPYQLKFIKTVSSDEKSLSHLFTKPDMFFVDRYNSESDSRFAQLKDRFPNLQKVRYLSSWIDTINRCVNKASTTMVWILDSMMDYSEFDFDYYPTPWQTKMVHMFGTQWSRWGTTLMINRDSFTSSSKHIKKIEYLPAIKFVRSTNSLITKNEYPIVFIDFGNDESSSVHEYLKNHSPEQILKISYNTSYEQTIRNIIVDDNKPPMIWICSSICDYSNFDFTYKCDPFAEDQLHVFPSNDQKYGDTFLLSLDTLSVIKKTGFSNTTINFNKTQRAKRLKEPSIIVSDDTHTNAIHTLGNFPYSELISSTEKDIRQSHYTPISLWNNQSKNILVLTDGASRVIVPREAAQATGELYNYPYIIKLDRLAKSSPMDIVFLSNGEPNADENYEHLKRITHKIPNRVTRVDGVDGRVEAYHAAASASNTPWMFTVFAKLRISEVFDFSWQPDRLQYPKHYIFYAQNPVNGLIYGHQGMILYNKKLVLENPGIGLDFTLDDEHAVIDIVSGVAYFNTSPYATWRTAFREVIKLIASDDPDNIIRLNTWKTIGFGEFGKYSIQGALDAVEYYNNSNGDPAKLKLSYEWRWLKEYYGERYEKI